MKQLIYAFSLTLIFCQIEFTSTAQCNANAGNDTVLCGVNGINGLLIGGNPSATGGSGNYQYAWSTLSIGIDPYFTHASNFLDDTTVANPMLEFFPWGERRTVNLELFVTDDAGNQCSDSVNVTVGDFFCPGIQCLVEMNAGDTIQLGFGCQISNDSLIAFHWTGNNISDSLAENPFIWPAQYENDYFCQVTDDLGCSAISVCTVLVLPTSIDDEVNNFFTASVYPDPIVESSIIRFKNSNSKKLRVEIFNFVGKKIFQITSSGNSIAIGNAIQTSGEYFYRISLEGKTISAGRFTKSD